MILFAKQKQRHRHKDLLKISFFDPWVRKIPWRRERLPTPIFLPGEFHGQRSLVGHSSWGHRVEHNWVTNMFTFSLSEDRCSLLTWEFNLPFFSLEKQTRQSIPRVGASHWAERAGPGACFTNLGHLAPLLLKRASGSTGRRGGQAIVP